MKTLLAFAVLAAAGWFMVKPIAQTFNGAKVQLMRGIK